jgi:hypothetical protein
MSIPYPDLMFAYSKMCSTERSLACLVGLKKPEMATYHWSWVGSPVHVSALDHHAGVGRAWPRAERLQQMRSVLGRLDVAVKILPFRPPLGGGLKQRILPKARLGAIA